LCIGFQDRQGVVRGGVVCDEELEVPERLVEYAVQTLSEMFRTVVDGEEDGEFRV